MKDWKIFHLAKENPNDYKTFSSLKACGWTWNCAESLDGSYWVFVALHFIVMIGL